MIGQTFVKKVGAQSPLLQTPSRCQCAAAIFVIAMLAGCSQSSEPRCYPVRGQVLLGDQPVAEAMIVFHPQTPLGENVPKPIAQSDANGNFRLTTLKPGDGAPAGEYTITVVLREARQIGDELTRDGPNVLPPRYAKPETSDLKYTVVAGENTVPPLLLQR